MAKCYPSAQKKNEIIMINTKDMYIMIKPKEWVADVGLREELFGCGWGGDWGSLGAL